MLTPWKKLSQETHKAGHRTILRKTFLLPNGKESVYDVTHDGAVVCILALTPEQDVILARQFRPGPEKILLELPGGFIEPQQTPLEAAQEELLQETGFRGDMRFVSTRSFSGYSDRVYHAFVAVNCVQVAAQKLDEEEFIEVITLPLVQFRDHLRSGDLTDTVAGYAGLDALGLL